MLGDGTSEQEPEQPQKLERRAAAQVWSRARPEHSSKLGWIRRVDVGDRGAAATAAERVVGLHQARCKRAPAGPRDMNYPQRDSINHHLYREGNG